MSAPNTQLNSSIKQARGKHFALKTHLFSSQSLKMDVKRKIDATQCYILSPRCVTFAGIRLKRGKYILENNDISLISQVFNHYGD